MFGTKRKEGKANSFLFLSSVSLVFLFTLFFVISFSSVSYAGCTGNSEGCTFQWDSSSCSAFDGGGTCSWANNYNWTIIVKNMTGGGVAGVNISFSSPDWIQAMSADHPMASTCSYYSIQLVTNATGYANITNSSLTSQNISAINGPDCQQDGMTIQALYFDVNGNVSRMSKKIDMQKDAGMRPPQAPTPSLYLTHAVTVQMAPKWRDGFFGVARNDSINTTQNTVSEAENCSYEYFVYDNATGTQFLMGRVTNQTGRSFEKYYKAIYLPANRTYLLTLFSFSSDDGNCQNIYTPEQNFIFNTTPNPGESTADMDAALVRKFEPELNWTMTNINGTLSGSVDEYYGISVHPYSSGMSPYSAGFSPVGFLRLSNVSDYINDTGFYNFTLPGSSSISYVIEATGKNKSTGNYYTGFEIVSGFSSPTVKDISLFPAYGELYNPSNTWQGVNASKLVFLFNDTSTRQYSTDVGMTPLVNYPGGVTLTWMVFSETSGQNLMFPVSVGTNVTATVYSGGHAPLKKDITAEDFANGNGVNYTFQLKQFEMKSPDGNESFGDDKEGTKRPMMIVMQHNANCDKPVDIGLGPEMNQTQFETAFTSHPCYLAGPSPATNFDPLSNAILDKVNTMIYQMTDDGPPIITYYIAVDLFASGPPDVQYEDTADTSTSVNVDLDSNTAKLYQFGSTAPEIYSKVYVGMPAMADEMTGASVKIRLPYLYSIADSGWSLSWNTSINDTSTAGLPSTYLDYLTYYHVPGNDLRGVNPLNTSVTCSKTNRSATCYYNSTVFMNATSGTPIGGVVWLELPHFSGTGPYYFAGVQGAPDIAIHSPLNNSYTIDTTPAFTFNITDNNWALTNVSLFLVPPSQTGNTTAWILNSTNSSVYNATTTEIFAANAFADGTYFWALNATNADSNTTFTGVFNLTVDSTSPSIIANGASLNDTTLIVSESVEWKFNLTEANYNASNSHAFVVRMSDNDIQIVNDSDSTLNFSRSSGTDNEIITVDWHVGSSIAEGNYTFEFNTTDKAGNAAYIINGTHILVNKVPTYKDEAVNDTIIKSGDSVAFTFNMTESFANYTQFSVRIINASGVSDAMMDASNVSCTTPNGTVHVCTVVWYGKTGADNSGANVADGQYFLNITQTDRHELSSSIRSALTGPNVTIDNTVPTFTYLTSVFTTNTNYTKTNETVLFNFTLGDTHYNTTNVQIYIVNASTTTDQFANYTVLSKDQIALTATTNTIHISWNSTAHDNSELNDDTYKVIINATDTAGNSAGTLLSEIKVTVDNTAPSVSAVTMDDGTNTRTAATTQTLYVNGTLTETNVNTVRFQVFNTSDISMELINITSMTAVTGTSVYRYTTGFDSIYIPLGNWTVQVNVTDKAGNIGIGSTTIVSDVALRATLSGTASGSGTAGGTTPVNAATFAVIAKGYSYLGGYLSLTGPGAEAYVNNYNSQKQAFLSNVSSSPSAGDKFQLAGNSTYLNPADGTIELPAVTSAALSGTIFNHDVSDNGVYVQTIYMYITPYVSTTGTWSGTYGLGLFASSS